MMLNNRSENIDAAKKDTLQYLEKDNKSFEVINDALVAYRFILDLIPETITKMFSGHIFPYTESYIEIENTVNLSVHGFYKAAFVSLRACLELGLLCVYYDRYDNSESIILEWLKSQEPTPFKKTIINGLTKIDNVTAFNFKVPILANISDLYSELSNYVHTNGVLYSSFHLNGSNVNNFNEKTFLLWRNFLETVVDDLSILFLLKYPVGLLYTPIDEKFGLNGPVGGFLNPHQRTRILNRYDAMVQSVLIEIGENDKDAQEMAQVIVDMPDISDEEMQEQADKMDKADIERMGYHLCYKNMIKPSN